MSPRFGLAPLVATSRSRCLSGAGRNRPARRRISLPRPEHAYTKKLMRATPRLGVSLRDLLPEEEALAVMAGLSRPKDGAAPASPMPGHPSFFARLFVKSDGPPGQARG